MNLPDLKLFRYWGESEFAWRQSGRKQLNRITRIVNKWQTKHRFDLWEGRVALAEIERGLNSFARQDGGSAWYKQLEEMRDFVTGAMEEIAGA